MDVINVASWRSFADARGGPCVSLFMPTFPGGPDEYQDHLRLKNLTAKAERELCDHGMDSEQAHDLSRKAMHLAEDGSFWHDRSNSLAVLMSPQVFQAFRLPVRFAESLHVGRRFHVGKMLPLILDDLRYALLAFSRHRVRMFHGSRFTFTQVDPPGLPTTVAETMGYEPVTGTHQMHSGASASLGKAGAVHHGQGGHVDAEHNETKAFFREIDTAVYKALQAERLPLILASTHPNVEFYSEINRYPDVVQEAVFGNPDRLSLHELHSRSWSVAEQLVRETRKQAVDEYLESCGTAMVSNSPRVVILGAAQGRVKSLFVQGSKQLWGTFDEPSQTIHLSQQQRQCDDDLVDWTAVESYCKRGAVHFLEPGEWQSAGFGDSPLACVFRY